MKMQMHLDDYSKEIELIWSLSDLDQTYYNSNFKCFLN